MLVILFVGAGLVSAVSYSTTNAFSLDNMKYLDAFYYMIVTASTIGYGDIYPKSVIARFIVLAILLCVFAVLGDNISKIG